MNKIFFVFIMVILLSCAKKENSVSEIIDTESLVNHTSEIVHELNENIANEINGTVQYTVRGDKAYRIIDNEQYQIDGVTVENSFIKGWCHYYFILDEYNKSKLEYDKLGTYLFNYKGELIDIIPFGTTAESTGIFFSPEGNFFGIDSGTWTIRGMTFYSYPEYKKIGYIVYNGRFFWKENTIIYTTVGNDNIPESPFDDTYYHFIEEFNLQTGEKRILYYFTELADAYLHDFICDTLIIRKRYVDNSEDWKDYEKYKNKIELKLYESIR